MLCWLRGGVGGQPLQVYISRDARGHRDGSHLDMLVIFGIFESTSKFLFFHFRPMFTLNTDLTVFCAYFIVFCFICSKYQCIHPDYRYVTPNEVINDDCGTFQRGK